jgi:hypothetical protein
MARNGWGVRYWSTCRTDACSPAEEFAANVRATLERIRAAVEGRAG